MFPSCAYHVFTEDGPGEGPHATPPWGGLIAPPPPQVDVAITCPSCNDCIGAVKVWVEEEHTIHGSRGAWGGGGGGGGGEDQQIKNTKVLLRSRIIFLGYVLTSQSTGVLTRVFRTSSRQNLELCAPQLPVAHALEFHGETLSISRVARLPIPFAPQNIIKLFADKHYGAKQKFCRKVGENVDKQFDR